MKKSQSKQRTKIASLLVYGGSFDPIHLGHIKALKLALHSLSPTLAFLTPAFINPFKSHTTFSPNQRVKWLKRAIRQNIQDERVKLCLFEITQHKPTPTIQTILYLKKRYNIKKLYFLLGADNASHLHTWDEFEKLNTLVEFIFLTREGYTLPPTLPYTTLALNLPISSTQIRNGEKREFLPKFLQGLR